MQQYLTDILDRVKAEQRDNHPSVCPRCGRDAMRPTLLHNCLSRDKSADVYICTNCGTDEALRDLEPDKKMRLSEWAAVKKELEGKTFLDLLRSGRELDCDLIISNSDMPATFVWDDQSPLTVYGEKYYAALLESPYEELPGGNIEVFCDDRMLGEHFTLAAAGHIGLSEYHKLFADMEISRDHIVIARDLRVTPEGICARYEVWFDADEMSEGEATPSEGEYGISFAVYNPETDNLRLFNVIHTDSTGAETQDEAYPTQLEVELLKEKMSEACAKEHHCTLAELWNASVFRPDSPQWQVTDDSCWQCCREVSEKVFELIQVCKLNICKIGERFAVARYMVDLDEYTVEQWEEYVELFGHDGFRGFISDNANTFSMRIIAEYIFETNWLSHLLKETYDSFDAAARYIAGIVDCEIDVEGE